MNRMKFLNLICCITCASVTVPLMAQEDAAADLGFDSGMEETSTNQLIDPSEVTDSDRAAAAADLVEQERVRREAAAREGRKAMTEALDAMQRGQWAIAVNLFDQALGKMEDVEKLQEEIQMARQQKSEAYFQMARGIYERRREGGDLEQAERFLTLSEETWPNDKVDLLREDIDAYKKRVAEGKEEIPIREEEKYQSAREAINDLLSRGRKELEIGDYDQAEETFERVLFYDRYNHAALRFIEKVAEERYEARRMERKASTMKMLEEVEERWLVPLRVDQRGAKEVFETTDTGIVREESALEQKLSEIVIDEIRFQRANISDVISFLVQASREQDPEGTGVNIIFMDPELGGSGAGDGAGAISAPAAADPFGFGTPTTGGGLSGGASTASPIPPITLELRKVTLLDALRTVTEIAGLYYRIDRNLVIIEREGQGELITRFYPVDPTRWTNVSAMMGSRGGGGAAAADPFGGDPFGGPAASAAPAEGPDLLALFSRYGMEIPQGGQITYEPMISQLVVTLTPNQFPQFENILTKINVAPRQVEIEARFVEVLQRDLEQLGFEWILTDNAEIAVEPGPGSVASRPRIQADQNLNGLSGGLRFFDFDANSNQALPAARNAAGGNSFLGNILSFSGILTNPELQLVVQALDQKGNSDLLSAPRVTTINGVNAVIEVVREIIYPTEFDITENDIGDIVTGDGANFFLPPTVEPGGFETRDVGVILNVTPTVNADNYTINLVLLPEIAELVDWLQYGSTIPTPEGGEYQVNLPQPIFASRNITTSMIVWDGHTVVMGGLIREDLVTIDDKIPILGDIPIIGRLFRSEGRRSEKRNLLIFVTARLVDPAGNSINAEDRDELRSGGSTITSAGGPVSTQ
jgi:general secretion pathway protein D